MKDLQLEGKVYANKALFCEKSNGFLNIAPKHTFHLLCGECTTIFEDVALQLGLLVDGLVITGSAVVPGKVDLYRALLGKVSDRFEDVSGHDTEQYVDRWLPTSVAIMDMVATIVSTSQSD
ncbi:hypothetical protein J1N35_033903 [Gossypium stocksii]|uniref:Uncharacterized protein n=1 Tax=Gossypium stocksii TaxID=47602 RepID=A0A9D3ZPR1_9ROSI|nr:hypothetical protein J1N35_033903 [Gossypium stocksii]